MAGVPKWHDPDAKLDYLFDWAGSYVLMDGDVIVDATVTTSAPGVVLTNVSHTDSTVTVWVEGGTVGQRVLLDCHVVTALGREDDETGVLVVREQ